MRDVQLKVTYIGGPTALLELNGLRILTDPTFDPAGEEYRTNFYTLRKNAGPGISLESAGGIDAVLLSHDHHFDNLDHSGRALLGRVEKLLTTPAGAERLGGNAFGLASWQQFEIPSQDNRILRIIATPARHGPADGDRGPVTGFVLFFTDSPQSAIYISGDTVWYEGIVEIAERFTVKLAFLFMGAARVAAAGPAHLTFTAVEAVEAARAFKEATIIPLHFEDWAHFSESREQIERTFAAARLNERLQWLERAVPTSIIV